MKTKQTLGIALTLMVTPVFAGTPYGIGGIGLSKYKLERSDYPSSQKNTALMLGIGYKLSNTFSAEATFTDLGNAKNHITYQDLDEEYQTDASSLQLSVLAHLHINESSSIYGRLGVAAVKWDTNYETSGWNTPVTSTSESGTDTKAVYGAGFQYILSQSLALRIEYDQISDINDLSISAALAGITYQF